MLARLELLDSAKCGDWVPSSGRDAFPGRAASIRGSDGNNNGIIYLELKNSPSNGGGFKGSQVCLFCGFSNRTSMFCPGLDASDEAEEAGNELTDVASFIEEEMLSRSRSFICFDVDYAPVCR